VSGLRELRSGAWRFELQSMPNSDTALAGPRASHSVVLASASFRNSTCLWRSANPFYTLCVRVFGFKTARRLRLRRHVSPACRYNVHSPGLMSRGLLATCRSCDPAAVLECVSSLYVTLACAYMHWWPLACLRRPAVFRMRINAVSATATQCIAQSINGAAPWITYEEANDGALLVP
jgi:hypothetical protein